MNITLPPLSWRNAAAPDMYDIQFIGEGDFCTCYLVNQSHVLRIARHFEASEALRREMLLLPNLEQYVDIQIPQIVGAGIRKDSGEQFIFYPFIPGTTLDRHTLMSLDPICRSEMVRQMAGFASQLHNFPVEIARSSHLKEVVPHRYLPELIERAREVISRQLDPAVWRYYERLVDSYLESSELSSYKPTLLHGDLSPGHFLCDLDRCNLTGVIDFGDSLIGDPCWDFIFVLEDYGKDVLEQFLHSYSPDSAPHSMKLVQLFQQLDNVAYCLSKLSSPERTEDFDEAIRTLVTQAFSEPVV